MHEERIPPDEWSAADLDAHDHGYGVGWLVFAAGVVTKRLRLYPANWARVSDHVLSMLCGRARRVRAVPVAD